MSTHIVTQIKREVDQSKLRQYSANKQKKQLKYYSLYLKQITRIQRYFRKFLIKKTRVLQTELIKQLTQKQLLHFSNKNITQQLQQQNQKRLKLRTQNIGKQIQHQKQNISSNIREMVKNVVNCADKYAKNMAVSKIVLDDLQMLKREEQELQVQVRELELEKQCYEQRVGLWSAKIKELRERIIEELSIKRQFEKQLNSFQ